MSNRFLVFVIVIVVGFFGFVAMSKKKSTNKPGSSTSSQTSNHVEGENKAGVTLVEFGDFQCPACKQYFPVVEQVVEKHKANIQFQFRHFPLTKIHRHAFEGSRAAEAASKQGKFWEMYRILYQDQDSWSTQTDPLPTLIGYASQLGLNTEQFKTDYASSAVNDIINGDLAEANKVGADSTPTFVLNGKKLDKNPESAEAFDKLITDAIAATKKSN